MNDERISEPSRANVVRRARPHLGTLVEIGVASDGRSSARAQAAEAAIAAAFVRIVEIESTLSRFDSQSAIGRFNAAEAGASIAVGDDACVVLAAAGELCEASDGLFDISLGTGRDGWACDGFVLRKLRAGARLDLGGIAKGHAVDVAIAALQRAGVAAGWVNAGGDLRVFGALALPIDLRDEQAGGVRRFATLEDGAFATSWLAGATRHASVAAGRCIWADALTKVVALSGDVAHPLVAAHDAQAWLH
ncbi:MAG: FAD:protein FMN transferase [Caldimonas sp.]